MPVDSLKRDPVDGTIVGSGRQVLLAISAGDDIILSSKAAIAAAAAPGSRVLVVHLAQLRPSLLDAELGEQMKATLAQAIKLIEAAGIPASGVVTRPGQGLNVIAGIAEEWHADVTVMGSKHRRDLATMFLRPPA
jgi:nucleotide-binding universal stress UspA family protein